MQAARRLMLGDGALFKADMVGKPRLVGDCVHQLQSTSHGHALCSLQARLHGNVQSL